MIKHLFVISYIIVIDYLNCERHNYSIDENVNNTTNSYKFSRVKLGSAAIAAEITTCYSIYT